MGVADITLSQAITQQLNQQELSIANLEEQVSSGRAAQQTLGQPCRRHTGAPTVLAGKPALELAGERGDGHVLVGNGK